MSTINIAGSVLPKTRNTPTRDGDRIANEAAIFDVVRPWVGQVIYCEGNGKRYEVLTLNADGDAVGTYKEYGTNDSAGAFRFVGNVDSVSALASKTATAKSGYVYRVAGGGNYAFVEEVTNYSVLGDLTKSFNIDKTIIVLPATIVTNAPVKVINNGVTKDAKIISQDGKFVLLDCVVSGDKLEPSGNGVWAYDNGSLFVTQDGSNILVLNHTAAEWVNISGDGVTATFVEEKVNALKTYTDEEIDDIKNDKQDTLTSTQLAAVNSGITAEKLADIQRACLADADEANELIKVKIAGKNEYMFVKAAKLVAPTLNMGSANIDAVTDTIKIVITATSGAEIYYTDGDQDPGTSSSHGTSRVEIEVDDCLEATSQEETISAKAKLNGIWSEKKTQKYTISRKLGALTFSATGDKYTEVATKRSISIAGASGATIYYRIGTTGDWLTYSSAIVIEEDTTIQAYQKKDGWKDSDVEQKDYEIGKGVIYIGAIAESASAPASLSDIKSKLGVIKQDALPASYTCNTEGQLKICIAYKTAIAGTLKSITDESGQPYLNDFNGPTIVDGFRVYCMKTAARQKTKTYTFKA